MKTVTLVMLSLALLGLLAGCNDGPFSLAAFSLANCTVSPGIAVGVNAAVGAAPTITVTVKNASSTPVAGITVALTRLPTGVTIASTLPTNGITPANGQVVFTLGDPATAASGNATITVGGQTLTSSYPIVFSAGPAFSLANCTVSPGIATGVNTTVNTPATITVTVKDASSNPVPGITVELPGLPFTVSSLPTDGVTLANGQVVFTIVSSVTASGNATIIIGGQTFTSFYPITFY